MKAIVGSLAFVVLLAGSSNADLIFNLDGAFSGASPSSPTTPWTVATFTGSGTVELTLSCPNLTGTEFVSSWYFNLDPGLDPAKLQFSYTSASIDSIDHATADSYKADGDGLYDVRVNFETSNSKTSDRFGAGETVKISISYQGGTLTEDNFDFWSKPAGGSGPFETAAHIQSIGVDDSGWIAPGGNPVPEVGTLFLGIMAASGCLGLIRKRRKA